MRAARYILGIISPLWATSISLHDDMPLPLKWANNAFHTAASADITPSRNFGPQPVIHG